MEADAGAEVVGGDGHALSHQVGRIGWIRVGVEAGVGQVELAHAVDPEGAPVLARRVVGHQVPELVGVHEAVGLHVTLGLGVVGGAIA